MWVNSGKNCVHRIFSFITVALEKVCSWIHSVRKFINFGNLRARVFCMGLLRRFMVKQNQFYLKGLNRKMALYIHDEKNQYILWLQLHIKIINFLCPQNFDSFHLYTLCKLLYRHQTKSQFLTKNKSCFNFIYQYHILDTEDS